MIAENLYLLRPGVLARCKRCRERLKVLGDLFVITTQTAKAIDGKKAARIAFICHGGHVHLVGWTRPVDFSDEHEAGT